MTAQASGAVRAIHAMHGNMGQAQRAIGDTVLESAIQLMIAKNVADGNINGPTTRTIRTRCASAATG